jgi:hypothetical protein
VNVTHRTTYLSHKIKTMWSFSSKVPLEKDSGDIKGAEEKKK